MKASIFYIICATLALSIPLNMQNGLSQNLYKRQAVGAGNLEESAQAQGSEEPAVGPAELSQEQQMAKYEARVQSNQLQGATKQILTGSLGDRLVVDAFEFDGNPEPVGLKSADTLKQEGWSDEQIGSLRKMDQDYRQAQQAVAIGLVNENPNLFPAQGPPQSNPAGNPSADGTPQQAGTAEAPTSEGGVTVDQFNVISDARQESPEIQAINQRISEERVGDRPVASAFQQDDMGFFSTLKDDAALKKEGWSDEQISSLKSLNDELDNAETKVVYNAMNQNPKLFPAEDPASAPQPGPASNPSTTGPFRQAETGAPGTSSGASDQQAGIGAPVSEQSSGQSAQVQGSDAPASEGQELPLTEQQYDAISNARSRSSDVQGVTQRIQDSLGDRPMEDAFQINKFGQPIDLQTDAILKQQGWTDEQVSNFRKLDQDLEQADTAVISDVMKQNPTLFLNVRPPQSNPAQNPSANGAPQSAASDTPQPLNNAPADGAAGSTNAVSGTAEEPSSDGGMTADQYKAIADAKQQSPEIQGLYQRISNERLGDRPLTDAFESDGNGAFYALKVDENLKKEGWSDEEISSLNNLHNELYQAEQAARNKAIGQNPELFPNEAAALAPNSQPGDNPSANGSPQSTESKVPGTPPPTDKPADAPAADSAAMTPTPPANAAVPAPSGGMASPPEAATNPQALVSQPAAPVSAGASLSGVPTQAAQQQVNGNTGSNTNAPVAGGSDSKQATAGLNPAKPAGQPALKQDQKPAVNAPTPQSAKLPTSQPAKVPPAPKVTTPKVTTPKATTPKAPAPKAPAPKAPAPKPASAPKTNSK
ncbi:hypothetical protein MP228_008356 [Amoeboaphelidium protococcarum]|nr:hypothetical protein MP228_008356 [Amoeboaphelidium protococcarum]